MKASNDIDDRSADFLARLRPLQRDLEVFARRWLGHSADADDALQLATLRAYQAFDRFNPEYSFRGWIFRILTRELLALQRRQRRRQRHEGQMAPEILESWPDSSSVWRPDRREYDAESDLALGQAWSEGLDDRLLAGLRRLTDNECAVLLLQSVGGLRYREISETLDIPIGSVMGHLARARQKMRTMLAAPPTCLTPGDPR